MKLDQRASACISVHPSLILFFSDSFTSCNEELFSVIECEWVGGVISLGSPEMLDEPKIRILLPYTFQGRRMMSNLRPAFLVLFSLGLQAQAVGGVEIQRLDGGQSVVLPAPSPAFMDAVLSRLVGEAPPIGPASEKDDPATNVEWTVRGSLSPAFSEDTTFTFVAYRDGHRTLTVTRPMIVNAWYQMSGSPYLFESRSDPKTVAAKLLSHRWTFSSREHPELVALMDEIKALPDYRLFPKAQSDELVVVLDGPSYSFDLTTSLGSIRLSGFSLGPNDKIYGWIDRCIAWIEVRLKATEAQDLKDGIARMDTSCVGPVILGQASRQGLRNVVKQLLDAGVPVDSADPIEQRTPLMNAAVSLDLDLVRLLLKRGAQVDLQDVSGQTALCQLLDRGRYTNPTDFDISKTTMMAEILLEAGASPDRSDKRGDSPRSIASKSKYADILKLFAKSH